MRPYVPLSQRSPAAIRHQSELYRAMAATARTAQAKRGLEVLAVRFAALADRREASEADPRQLLPVQEMSSAAD